MFLRLLLNCSTEASLICTIFVYGVAKLKCEFIIPQIKKLDPKTISGYFGGYCIGFRVQDSFVQFILLVP